MKTFDGTATFLKQYPGVMDLATENEFSCYLADKGIKVTPDQLRQYRHRDSKFVYIKRGNAVFYPKHINEHLVREMNV